jgi:hypothetical protein
MDIALLYFNGCPNWRVVDERLAAIAAERPDLVVIHQLVESAAEAERLGCHGSPSIVLDGVDAFADADAGIGLSCRATRRPRDRPARPPSSSYVRLSRMRERHQGLGWAAGLAGAFGICCGIPVLGTLGLLGFLAGLSLASWTLIGLATAAAVVGGLRLFKNRHRSAVVTSVAQLPPPALVTDHDRAGKVALGKTERHDQGL